MIKTPIPFIGGFYTVDSLNINAQRCLNWYPETDISGMGKSGIAAKPTPGLKLFSTLTGGGAIRGIYTASNNRFFGVCGNILSEVSSDGTATARGTINSTEGIVRMSDNGIDLIIVDGVTQEGWTMIFSTNAFVQITDSGYPGGSHVSFINQRYVVNKPNTQQFQWSALVDGTSWPALNIASAESTPDNINSTIALGGELWTFGPQSYEVQYDTGVANDLYNRIEGTPNDIGTAAPNSLARSNTNIFWLGADDNGHGTVFMNEGYRPRRISTHPIEQTIQRYSKLDDAIGYCYQQLGHDFYVLNFPTAGATWVFDLSTGLWHERSWTDNNNNSFMNRGIVQDFFNGEVYVGDWGNSNIYELDPDTYTDNGDEIHREITSPHIWNNLDRSFYGAFQLDFEPGIGLISGQGENPQIMLQISNDGGHSYGSEKWRGAGKLGEYRKRIKWNRLGYSRDRVFRITATDPVKWIIIGAFIEVE